MRIVSIVGARPQFIKLAALSAKLAVSHEEIIVHTGQHYDYSMSERIFSDLGIRNPDYHLGVGSGSHATQTGEMMKALEEVMLTRKPQLVVIFGDTNTTLAGALAASKINIPIVHVEAGLRSYNRNMPEEINRIIADHVSDYLFAPTQNAAGILKNEGLEDKTHLTGDIMVDTLSNNLQVALEISQITKELEVEGRDFNLLTLHRNYNVDNPEILVNILDQLDRLGELIIFPVHPRTKKIIENTEMSWENISLTEPLGYIDFIAAEHYSKRIITDSGGIQKEAFILGRPCITLRTETEWIETVEAGWNLLVDPSVSDICDRIRSFEVPDVKENIFGEDVSSKMAVIINSI